MAVQAAKFQFFSSFTLWGIRVETHWSTALLPALMALQVARGTWGAAILVAATVLIVLLHELGHAWTCRWVGGKVAKVVLWPFGGIAHVTPPGTARSVFWTVAGGPLVNVLLAFPFYGLAAATNSLHWREANALVREMFAMNVLILLFNLVPVYPLDGARLVHCLLWRGANRWRAASVSGLIGMACSGAGVVTGIMTSNVPLAGLALVGVGFSLVEGQRARKMAKSMQRQHLEFVCPSCRAHPPLGAFWQCGCGERFDAFAHGAACPGCQKCFPTTTCLACGGEFPLVQWGSLRGSVRRG